MRALAVVFVVLAALSALPAAAQAEVTWLCLPGSSPNPCDESLDTTVQEADGGSRVESPQRDPRPRVDCFYVYPTVSDQVGPNANKAKDPEVQAIARFQAQRFSQQCRVFAPVYRQGTVPALLAETRSEAARELAYSDVREAWQEYLRVHNGGRPVVLIGHSQGTTMLRALMRREIDNDESLRRRLVSALLLGGNVLVEKGRPIGGDFANVPACSRPGQYGCVVAWSAFNETPPSDSRFGRSPSEGSLGSPFGPRYEVLCTDPERLARDENPLTTYVRTDRFPGLIGASLLYFYGGEQPSAPTPWLQPADRYTGRCATENGANVLKIDPVGNARKLNPSPDDTWGLHLGDVNLAYGELEDIVGAQTRGYFKLAVGFGRMKRAIGVRRARFAVRCRARGFERRTCAARAYVRRGGRRLRVGAGKSGLSRRSARVRLRLNGRGRRALRARGSKSLRVLLEARVRGRAGRFGSARRRFAIKSRR